VSAIATDVADSPPGSPPPEPASGVALLRGLVRSMRPKQFVKNLLVFAAPVAGGVLDEGSVLTNVLLAFVAFCLVSAATYMLNDVGDVAEDRVHPTKRYRPVAAGIVPVRVAVVASLVLLAAGLAVAFAVNWQLGVTVAAYKVVTTAYTYWLKDLPVFDIAVVASGFIVRAVAGGLAADIPLSRWFLIVACFGALFMVAGKRHGELMHIGDASTRPALAEYTLEYLRFVWTMSAAVAVGAYCLWAFDHPASDSGVPWWGLSIAPFVVALMRYALLVERGEASSPEEVVLGDRTIQILGAVWLGMFVCSVYVG
jgi:decaprenyl-phosphate phosphoribosyltransferase